MLLERGADPNKRYFFGAEINLANDNESLELLLNFGANTETRDRSGLTPLMRYARSSGGMEAVLLLLKYGADVNAMADGRNDFQTVLHYAILSGNISYPILPGDPFKRFFHEYPPKTGADEAYLTNYFIFFFF